MIDWNRWIDFDNWNKAAKASFFVSVPIVLVVVVNFLIGDPISLWERKIVLYISLTAFIVLAYRILCALSHPFDVYLVSRRKQKGNVSNKQKKNEVAKSLCSYSDNSPKQSSSGNTNKSMSRDELKAAFVKEYVRVECKGEPIYDVFESLFDQKKSGAFAARAFKCAMSDPIKWLKSFPGYEDAKRLFPKRDAIKGGKTNYSNANNTVYSEDTMNKTVKDIQDKLEELTPPPTEE